MPILWLDIETGPSEHQPDPASLIPPANYSKPDSIAKWQAENVDKAWREQALDSMSGRIISVAWAIGNAPPVCRGIWDRTERDILTELDSVAGEISSEAGVVRWGGFNIVEFDLRWLYHRALKHDLAYLKDNIRRDRYPNNVVDVRDLWTGGDRKGKGKMKDICRFLGVKLKSGLDGSQVFDLFLAGEYAKISEYNISDVEGVREIARIMGAAQTIEDMSTPTRKPSTPRKKSTKPPALSLPSPSLPAASLPF